MISLSYAQFAAIDETLARHMLPEAYHDLGGNVSQTASKLSCSRTTVRKWVRRHRGNPGFQDRSRRPQNCPGQTPADMERLVVRARKKTNLWRIRLAHHLQQQRDLTLSPHTVRNFLRRHNLSQPQKKRGKFRPIRTHGWQSLSPPALPDRPQAYPGPQEAPYPRLPAPQRPQTAPPSVHNHRSRHQNQVPRLLLPEILHQRLGLPRAGPSLAQGRWLFLYPLLPNRLG